MKAKEYAKDEAYNAFMGAAPRCKRRRFKHNSLQHFEYDLEESNSSNDSDSGDNEGEEEEEEEEDMVPNYP